MVVGATTILNRRRVHHGTGYNTRRRYRKEWRVRPWRRYPWARDREEAACAAEGAPVYRPAAALSHWDGSFGRGALLGTGVYQTGAHGEIDVPAVRQTVCAKPEKRSQ